MDRFIVYFTQKQGATVQLNSRLMFVAAFFSLAILVTSGMAVGYWLGFSQQVVVSDNEMRDMQTAEVQATLQAIQAAKKELEIYRQETSADLTAITKRLGSFQANITRLNALGERLTKVAGVKSDEFAFDVEPAIGGPESESDDNAVTLAGIDENIDNLLENLANKEHQLMLLEELILNTNYSETSQLSGRPIKRGWLSSYYGMRVHPISGKKEMHKGVDLAGKKDSEIVAVAAGVVTYSGDRWAYGNMVEIDHGNGYITRYAHNTKNLVKVGARVAKGQSIALMGSTGRSTGPHVHFEVIKNGRHVDPVKYLAKR